MISDELKDLGPPTPLCCILQVALDGSTRKEIHFARIFQKAIVHRITPESLLALSDAINDRTRLYDSCSSCNQSLVLMSLPPICYINWIHKVCIMMIVAEWWHSITQCCPNFLKSRVAEEIIFEAACCTKKLRSNVLKFIRHHTGLRSLWVLFLMHFDTLITGKVLNKF